MNVSIFLEIDFCYIIFACSFLFIFMFGLKLFEVLVFLIPFVLICWLIIAIIRWFNRH